MMRNKKLQKRNLIKILGVNIDNVTKDEMGNRIKELVLESKKTCKMVVSPNTEFIMTAWKDKEFWEILNKADLSTPDSVGVSIGGKLQKKPFKARISDIDLYNKVNLDWKYVGTIKVDDIPAFNR